MQSSLKVLRDELLSCTKCTLSDQGRSQVVFGAGKDLSPDIMFVGEGPGAEEDSCGIPFSGRAGVLLTKMIESIGYTREDVYIDNIVKCRPPGNRKPTTAEAKICTPHVEQQVDFIQPLTLVCVGSTAAENLLKIKKPMYQLRGHWYSYKGIPTRVIYHPAYLLRLHGEEEKKAKKETWEDLMEIRTLICDTNAGQYF
jgi:uracil-DNA glycosylase family 4